MNERIKQLVLQAKIGTADFDAGSYYVATPDRMQEFAELIVRECICQCDDENSQKYIMSHFGFTEKDWS
jgi:hypothetical protein